MIFQTNATITKVMTMADQGIRVQIDTPELPENSIAKLFGLRNKEMWVAMKDVPLKEEDITVPEYTEATGKKTPSQRLRASIFIFWEQQTDRSKPFDDFYREYMQKIIDQVQNKLE